MIAFSHVAILQVMAASIVLMLQDSRAFNGIVPVLFVVRPRRGPLLLEEVLLLLHLDVSQLRLKLAYRDVGAIIHDGQQHVTVMQIAEASLSVQAARCLYIHIGD